MSKLASEMFTKEQDAARLVVLKEVMDTQARNMASLHQQELKAYWEKAADLVYLDGEINLRLRKLIFEAVSRHYSPNMLDALGGDKYSEDEKNEMKKDVIRATILMAELISVTFSAPNMLTEPENNLLDALIDARFSHALSR
ncbi:MAG: hypothetical protein KOO63_05395 [Bacteroidales bacterium]|nr:hypothetical protein [Candidatus Latescibacterota bacterium]